jgi:hypothetical protein
MRSILIQATLVMVSFNLLLTLAVIVNRFVMTAIDRRYAAALAKVRPEVLGWIDGDDVDLRLEGRERKALTELLARYGRAMQGEARARLATLSRELGICQEVAGGLRSRRGWKRAAAAFRLGDLGAAAITELIAALSDPDRRVRNAATRSLGRLEAVEAVEPLVVALAAGRIARAVAGQALLDIGTAAALKLDRLLSSPDPQVRAAAAELLGRLAVGHSPILVAAVEDPNPVVRVAVARAFGRLGTRSAARVLPEMLDDPVPYVRAAAASASADLGLTELVPRLLVMARHDDYVPAAAASRALGLLEPALLLAAENDPNGSPHMIEARDLLEVRR